MSSTTLSIRVDSRQKKRLEALAKSTGRSRSYLAADAIAAYLDVNEWQVAGIEKVVASIDATGGIPHADVKAWVRSWKGAALPRRTPRARRP